MKNTKKLEKKKLKKYSHLIEMNANRRSKGNVSSTVTKPLLITSIYTTMDFLTNKNTKGAEYLISVVSCINFIECIEPRPGIF